MKKFSDLGNYLSETSKYANIEMTMVAKMNFPTYYHVYHCAPHRSPVEILCKQLENLSTIKFVEGAVINYAVILSLSMRLQIVANHP